MIIKEKQFATEDDIFQNNFMKYLENKSKVAFVCFSITDKKSLAYKEYADALSKLPSKH